MYNNIRNFTRSIILSTIGSFSKVKNGTYFLNGHYVSRDNIPAHMQIDIFERLLKVLSKDFEFVTPNECIRNRDQKRSRIVCFTFDDGLEENHSVLAPVLERFNTRGIFFINPDFLGLTGDAAESVLRSNYLVDFSKNFLTSEQVSELASSGHVIGSHTASHGRVSEMNEAMIRFELNKSKAAIEAISKQTCSSFAYPFGGLNDISVEGLRIALEYYDYVFSSTTSNNLFEFDKQVINRRHFEGNWPSSHINFFLSRRA
jgi:peptidoglycan/xylan/chitin deacetylase (PgdA/CDA1 family)